MAELAVATRYLRRFELVLVIIGVMVLLDIGMDRISGLMAEAERLRVIVTVNNLRSALGYEIARRLVTGASFDDLTQLVGANPMNFASPPENYRGVADGPDTLDMPPGSWYFNRHEKALVYQVKTLSRFTSSLPTQDRVRFRIEARYRDNGPGRQDFTGVELVTLDQYQWRGMAEN